MPDTIAKDAPEAQHDAPSLARRLTLLGASSLTVMAGATIAPSLPELARHFADLPDAELLSRLVLTIPALAIAVMAPLAGYIIDRFGRRRMLIGGIIVYAIAGASGLWLDTLGAILVGRVVLGATIGAVMTTSITLISDYFVGPARERFMGLQTACMGLGGVAGRDPLARPLRGLSFCADPGAHGAGHDCRTGPS
jgi:MFS family permease